MGTRPGNLRIETAGPEEAQLVCRLVSCLLRELSEEGEGTVPLDGIALPADTHTALLARLGPAGEAIGVATLGEGFALFAGGRYGILNELYVAPEHRASGVGKALLDAVKETARARGWRRVDVTAPEAVRFERTRRFYEREEFRFTGPKLKWLR